MFAGVSLSSPPPPGGGQAAAPATISVAGSACNSPTSTSRNRAAPVAPLSAAASRHMTQAHTFASAPTPHTKAKPLPDTQAHPARTSFSGFFRGAPLTDQSQHWPARSHTRRQLSVEHTLLLGLIGSELVVGRAGSWAEQQQQCTQTSAACHGSKRNPCLEHTPLPAGCSLPQAAAMAPLEALVFDNSVLAELPVDESGVNQPRQVGVRAACVCAFTPAFAPCMQPLSATTCCCCCCCCCSTWLAGAGCCVRPGAAHPPG
jgi:hypothetical protein